MMLVIEVELLTGRYVATEHNDYSRAEWPPHPARFFSALVAALHDNDPVDIAERCALLWLEQQEPPMLDVDLDVDESLGRRQVHPVFVPVNDVTLVGDPERKLRELSRKLAELERRVQSKEVSTEVKKAQKAIENEELEIAKVVASLQTEPSAPSREGLKNATELLPERRNRQERTFPVVVPSRALLAFLWPDTEPSEHLDPLRRLCERVTRLGHSSSLVRCAVIERLVTPTLVPRADGECVLRVVGPGQLKRLEQAFERHRAVDKRVLPARPERYGKPAAGHPRMPCSVFSDDWVVFERVGGQRPLASRGSDLAVTLRRALIEINGKEDLPLILSGHSSDGERATGPHLACVPLPWVGHQHSDGSVQGLALVLPRSLTGDARNRLLRLLARLEAERGDPADDFALQLGTPPDLGNPLHVRFRRVDVPSKVTLNSARWCKPSRYFVSAIPIALDRHPGNLRSNVARAAHRAASEAEASIAEACERIGLPRPSNVSISLAPLLPGAQHVRQYSLWPPQPGRTRRAKVHAEIVFSEIVRGPVLIGAGRYFGLGLCLPVPERTEGGAN